MKKDNKGFTLAELIVVVAIIGLLIAIITLSISASLEKAREGTDLFNLRTGQSLLMNACLDETQVIDEDYSKISDKSTLIGRVCRYGKDSIATVVELSQTKDGWQTFSEDESPCASFVKGGAVVQAESLGDYAYYYLVMSTSGDNIGIVYDSGFAK